MVSGVSVQVSGLRSVDVGNYQIPHYVIFFITPETYNI